MAPLEGEAVGDAQSSHCCVETPSTFPEPQLRPREIEVNDAEVRHLNELLHEEYNLFLPFVQDLVAPEKARIAAVKVHERIDKVQSIWAEAAAKTREELARLKTDLREYSDHRRARLHRWKEGNVFSLPLEEIVKAYENQEPPNAESLLEYIRSALQAELSALQNGAYDMSDSKSEGSASEGSTPEGSTSQDESLDVHDSISLDAQVEKYMWLIQYLSRLPGGRGCAIHANAYYVMHFLRHGLISSYAYEDALEGMKETMHVGNSQPAEAVIFIDLASLYRELDHILQSKDLFAWRVYRSRESSVEIAEFLQQQAREEVRDKVVRTAGTIFPEELTEQIVEYALLAEGLSVDVTARYPEYRRQDGASRLFLPRPPSYQIPGASFEEGL